MARRFRLRNAKRRRTHRLIRAGDRTMTFARGKRDRDDGVVEPSFEEVEAALSAVPEELDWDWVSSRLIPLFERGYGEGALGDPMIDVVSHLGVGIGFGIDLGPVFGRVTRSMAQRWEASTEQIERAAFAHLAEVVRDVRPTDVQTVVHQGHLFRALGQPAGWASSVILAGEPEITRIFGAAEGVFTAPARNSLLMFDPATPARAIADITVELESADPHPLQLDPFELRDGVLRWGGLSEDEP